MYNNRQVPTRAGIAAESAVCCVHMHMEEAGRELQLRRPQEGVAEGQLKGSEGALERGASQSRHEAGNLP